MPTEEKKYLLTVGIYIIYIHSLQSYRFTCKDYVSNIELNQNG